jgi:hypothetical protein
MAIKNNKKKNTGEKPVNTEEFQEKQLRGVLLVMGAMILAGLIVYMIVSAVSNPEYEGLKFKKLSEGNIEYYVVNVPAIDPTTGQTTSYYEMVLRNNPEKLAEMVSFEGRGLLLRDIIISYSRSIEKCSNTIIGQGEFVRDFNGNLKFNIKGATNDYAYSLETNTTYATCDDAGENTVIIFQEENEQTNKTTIRETIPNCYVIDVYQCQTLEAYERFMLEIAARSANQR